MARHAVPRSPPGHSQRIHRSANIAFVDELLNGSLTTDDLNSHTDASGLKHAPKPAVIECVILGACCCHFQHQSCIRHWVYVSVVQSVHQITQRTAVPESAANGVFRSKYVTDSNLHDLVLNTGPLQVVLFWIALFAVRRQAGHCNPPRAVSSVAGSLKELRRSFHPGCIRRVA